MNKKVILLSSLFFLISMSVSSQKLTLTDLTLLCNKKNWEDVNLTLLSKNWTFYDSEKGSTLKYNTITWSYKKEWDSDKAQAWFYLFTYEGFPNKISYSVFNKESYTIIQNSIASAGFKLTNSEIEDNKIISTYSNANYTLKVSTEKRSKSDYSWENNSLTAYNFTLIKKAGVYDPDNGKKTEYYSDGSIEFEYVLLNGNLNGLFKSYHENGSLKKIGNYSNDLENGIFKEYDDDENLIAEYNMINGKRNGLLKIFENGKLSYSTVFKDDYKNGQFIGYYYNEETDKIQLKQIGEYVNDEKNGTWKLFFVDDRKSEKLIAFENYTRDLKNGPFQKVQSDSLIIGSYENDKLNGEFKIYRDLKTTIFGGVIDTNIDNLVLISEGSYKDDEKTGLWKNYDIIGTLKSEGRFLNGKETGEWKYYQVNLKEGLIKDQNIQNELYLIENYNYGKLEGKATRYYYREEEEYPCPENIREKSSSDTCIRTINKKIFETAYYKNGELNGPYELRDSINQIIAKGSFKDGLKEGEWLLSINDEDLSGKVYNLYQKGNFINDKKEGKWIQYKTEGKISESFHFKNVNLHGEYISWNNKNQPRERKIFSNGNLKELTVYDSLGIKPIKKYEIYEDQLNSYKCRQTKYLENNFFTNQEYWVKKEEEIDHNLYELVFELTAGNFSKGIDGYKDGDFNFYNDRNMPIVTGKYFKENKIGLWTYYFYDQKIKIESNFSNNNQLDERYFTLNGELFSGEFNFIDEDNGIIESRKIKNGLRNGKTTYTDLKTKKTIRKENYKNGLID